jgi:sugar lactone lactonase YvrE
LRRETRKVVGSLRLPEAARWHNGALWFVDILQGNLHRLVDTKLETIARLDYPVSLGFRGEHLLVTDLQTRQLHTVRDGKVVDSLDLQWLAKGSLNDMVVDRHGRTYLDDMGHDAHAGGFGSDGRILLVLPDSTARVVAEQILGPNGIAISPDGRMLVVGEAWGPDGRLSGVHLLGFDIEDDGSLSNRRMIGTIGRGSGDGICFDAEGGLWVCTASGNETQRFLAGEVVERVVLSDQKWALSCALGGPNLQTLFICTASAPRKGDPHSFPGGWDYLGFTEGWIEAVDVEVPGISTP